LLSQEEYLDLVRNAVKITNGRCKIFCNISSVNKEHIKTLLFGSVDAGVDAISVLVPMYLKPSQSAVIQYYKWIHDTIRHPIIVYNNPGRCGITLTNDTIEQLIDFPFIKGIKNCEENPLTFIKNREDFSWYIGDDCNALKHNEANGWVSVVCNLFPQICKELWKFRDFPEESARLYEIIRPVIEILSVESNPVVIKYLMNKSGLCADEIRFPLLKISEHFHSIADHAFEISKALEKNFLTEDSIAV
jgi:4-hydroxy-tetrahydrodipicolinate synthase